MIRKYDYLNNPSFLMKAFREKNLQQFIKITVLNFNEKPIKEIQGQVTSGSMTIDGKSSVRRTANLSVLIQDDEANYHDIKSLFSINKKVKIEIGIDNLTKEYPNHSILWFLCGTFAIMGLNLSHDTNGTTASLQLKDKMVFLNGECGGTIPASTVFHEYQVLDPLTGDYVIDTPTIVQIIRELVNHFGNESLNKIMINDLSTRIKKVMKWTQGTPLYFYQAVNEDAQSLMYTPDFQKIKDAVGREPVLNEDYKIFETGEDIGFVYTDFTFPGELIANAGNSVCDILDKIKNTLGNYEYFYDIYGNFIFQEVKNYLNTSKATVDINNMSQDNYLVDRKNGKAAYVFGDNERVTAYSNAPQYNMIKNDFVVWGMRESATGQKLPIRYHLAIDSKPQVGNTYKCCKHISKDDITGAEVISYQLVLIYSDKNSFPEIGEIGRLYEDSSNGDIFYWDSKEQAYFIANAEILEITTTDWRSELYLSGAMSTRYGINSNYYYTELANEWPKLYNLDKGEFKQEVKDYPNEIDFFLDFIDSSGAISELNISNIGRRSKVINDESINCVFEKEIPDYILLEAGSENIEELRQECIDQGQNYIQIGSSVFNGLALGGTQNSAYNMVRDLLYQYTSYNESITVQMLPLYFLEPNIRVTVQDKESHIQGDYMINSISIPFDISGTMTLSCIKALDRI